VPVRRVENLSSRPSIARDLALIKVAAAGDNRAQVMQLVDVYRARVSPAAATLISARSRAICGRALRFSTRRTGTSL